jgi:hypothetical protein
MSLLNEECAECQIEGIRRGTERSVIQRSIRKFGCNHRDNRGRQRIESQTRRKERFRRRLDAHAGRQRRGGTARFVIVVVAVFLWWNLSIRLRQCDKKASGGRSPFAHADSRRQQQPHGHEDHQERAQPGDHTLRLGRSWGQVNAVSSGKEQCYGCAGNHSLFA